MVKLYEQWSDVKGTRVDTITNNPDVLIDAYANNEKAYVILINLNFSPELVRLNTFGNSDASIQNVKIKHLYLNGDAPELKILELTYAPESYTLDTEATAILEYTFDKALDINKASNEIKYYADTYLHKINANEDISITINGVNKGSFGEGVLRLSIGRNHDLSLIPDVTFNGHSLEIPRNFSGDDQSPREQFFGTLEIGCTLRQYFSK